MHVTESGACNLGHENWQIYSFEVNNEQVALLFENVVIEEYWEKQMRICWIGDTKALRKLTMNKA